MVSGALAWNWMGGYLGQVCFGHAALFGVGGFVAARLMLQANPTPAPIAWLLGGLAAGIFSLGAHPMLRLRGPYFSIATIGVGEASRLLFTYWEEFTGGSSGLSLPIDIGMKARLYWWALGLMGARRRRVLRDPALDARPAAPRHQGRRGRRRRRRRERHLLPGPRDGPLRRGGGLTGGLYASFFSFIEPSDMFGFDRSIAFVLMSVIGGVGTILGPVLGAIVFVLLRQFLLASYPQLYLGLYGILLILIILFEPLGLTGLGLRLARAVRRRRAAAARVVASP